MGDFHINEATSPKFKYGDINIPDKDIIENGVIEPPSKMLVCKVNKDDVLLIIEEQLTNASWDDDHKTWNAINKIYESVRKMEPNEKAYEEGSSLYDEGDAGSGGLMSAT